MSSHIGVLALQGDFAAHVDALHRLGARVREVRRADALPGLDGLVIPGGESTALLCLMDEDAWFPALRGFHATGGALLGTCAGAILLASDVRPPQPSLGLLDASIERNAYGRQRDSFETLLDSPELGDRLPGVFIRAPRFLALGDDVQVLARHDGEPVLVRSRNVLAASFHPELSNDPRVHTYFLELAGARRRGAIREAS